MSTWCIYWVFSWCWCFDPVILWLCWSLVPDKDKSIKAEWRKSHIYCEVSTVYSARRTDFPTNKLGFCFFKNKKTAPVYFIHVLFVFPFCFFFSNFDLQRCIRTPITHNTSVSLNLSQHLNLQREPEAPHGDATFPPEPWACMQFVPPDAEQ